VLGEVGTNADADVDADVFVSAPPPDTAKDEVPGREIGDLRSGLFRSSVTTPPLASGLSPLSFFVSASVAFFLFEDFLHKRAAAAINPRASKAPTLEPAAVAEVAAADALLERAAEAAFCPPTTVFTTAIPPTKAAP
jgi:hypothetical protein